MLLDGAHEQNWKRNEEAPDHQQHAQRPPGLRVSRDEKLRFFGDVRVPDEHVLAEADVGPENAEGQHPFPHYVVMLDGDYSLQVTRLTQSRDHQHEERHGTSGCAREDVNAEHGREPAVVKAHQPIERAEGQTKREHWQTDERDLAHSDGEPRIAIAILAHRKSAQRERRQKEKPEEYYGAHKKEIPIEVSTLGIERLFDSRRDIHPRVEVVTQ